MSEMLDNNLAIINDTVDSLVINNNGDLQNAVDFIKEIKNRATFVKNHYEPMVSACKESYDKVRKERDYYLKPLEKAEQTVRDMVNDYNNKMAALQKAERIKKLKEDEELKEAVNNGNVDLILEKINSFEMAQNVNKAEAVGMGTRTKTTIKVVDIDKVPTKYNGFPILGLTKWGEKVLLDEYKKHKAKGTEFEIEGVEFVEELVTVLK